MLRNLRISGFRGLRELSMTGLGRVNLFVGTNNCGKTTVLEAIHWLSAGGTAAPIWQAQVLRGEVTDNPREPDVSHLVHGRQLVEGGGFRLEAKTDHEPLSVSASFEARDPSDKDVEDEQAELLNAAGLGTSAPPWMWMKLFWERGTRSGGFNVPITRRGSARERDLLSVQVAVGPLGPALLLGAGGMDSANVVALFDRVVLTPDEATVLGALQTIEPGIQRMASVTGQPWRSGQVSAGGIVMMVDGHRVPIGSMGDGIWRLLGIALALVNAKGGVLLVDEIDTGLHYSVLVDLWRLVLATARKLDVQVFATTHSRDCYEALAAVTEPDRSEISLQRIERGKPEAIGFTEDEIRQAAERGLEVR
ncbi:MAG TPA: AAA family ATPase [Kofleriaceae bacterium]|jgi:hypothetical protein|nr:AAA family ATPase [Kofleriaceae bacterium]